MKKMPSPKHYKTPDGHWKSERNLALQHRALMHDLLTKAPNGFVSLSAAISKGEQIICRTIREQKLPLIILLKDGFPKPEDPHIKYYKPGGMLFEACSHGRLLLLEPKIDVAIASLPSMK